MPNTPEPSAEKPTLRLVDRLRGKYVLPVNDGAGPLNGSMTFERQFETPPIQHEAADLIEELLSSLQGMQSFAAVMIGRGPDAVIPETVTSPLGPSIKIGNLMRKVSGALAKAEGRTP